MADSTSLNSSVGSMLPQVDFLEGMDETGGAEQLPHELRGHEGRYDAVCASMVLHVFETKEEVAVFVRRVLRLLKPGGTFFGRNRPQWVCLLSK